MIKKKLPKSKVTFLRVVQAVRLLVYKDRVWFWLMWAAICVAGLFDVLRPWMYKRLFDLLAEGVTETAPLMAALFAILSFYGASWVLNQIIPLLNDRFIPEVKARAIAESFQHLFKQSMQFFSKSHTGSLTQRIRRFSDAVASLLDILQWDVIPATVLFIGSLGSMYLRSPGLALMVFAWLIFYVVINIWVSKWKLKYDKKRSKLDSEVTAMLSDSFSHYPEVIAQASQKREHDRLLQTLVPWRKIQTFTWMLGTFNGAIQWGMAIILEMAVFYVAIRLWQNGVLTVGDFALLQGLLLGIFFQIHGLGRTIRNAFEAVAGATEMIEAIDSTPEILDSPVAKKIKIKNGQIDFDQVSFTYHSGRLAVDNLSFSVKPGERIALVGPSGAGKSTIIKLLLRFADVSGGSVKIDGQDIRTITQESLRSNIAFVSQEPAMFHRSIYENILYGRPTATRKEVYKAAELASCLDFIEALPEGFETQVGERGVHLSGGERQRVSLARAILKNAPILILDEATASLDSISEQAIQKALHVIMKDRTTIVIAHRLSTILSMDRILVIKGGQIIEEGPHEKLLTEGGVYANLWKLQSKGFLK